MAQCLDPVLVLCSLVSLFSFGLLGLYSVLDWPKQRTEALLWASPEGAGRSVQWVTSQCKILSVGIANRGGCWRRSPDNSMWSASDPAFYSECGGTRWCANEGDTCDCLGGDVTYALGEFQGNVPFGNVSAVLRNVTEKVRCWSGEGGSFHSDPAVGQRKFCFCTPAEAVGLVRRYGGLEPKGVNCSERANQAFRNEALLVTEQGPRRLSRAAGGPLVLSSTALADVSQKWMLPDGHCDSSSFTNMFDKDRTIFLPWALVEVQGAFRGQKEATKPRLRCAFSYGAEAVSREEYKGAKDLYSRWKDRASQSVPCYVRVGGECGGTGCAVALENVLQFGQEETASREMLYSFGYITAMIGGLFPLLLALLFVLACVFSVQLRRVGLISGGEEHTDEERSRMTSGVPPPS